MYLWTQLFSEFFSCFQRFNDRVFIFRRFNDHVFQHRFKGRTIVWYLPKVFFFRIFHRSKAGSPMKQTFNASFQHQLQSVEGWENANNMLVNWLQQLQIKIMLIKWSIVCYYWIHKWDQSIQHLCNMKGNGFLEWISNINSWLPRLCLIEQQKFLFCIVVHV